MMFLKVTNRFQAFLLHLAGSFLVISCSVLFIIGWLYPQPYFYLQGVSDPLVLLASLDIIIGPTLTLIIFKAGKRSLKFDIAVICLMQVSALLYGLHIMYSERPAFVAFSKDRFHVVEAPWVQWHKLPDSVVESRPFRGPMLVYAQLWKDGWDVFLMLQGKKRQSYQVSEHYEPLINHVEDLVEGALDLTLLKPGGNGAREVGEALDELDGDPTNYLFFPIRGKRNWGTLILEAETGRLVSYLKTNLEDEIFASD